MSTAHHTAIATGAAADALTVNNPLGQLDAAIDDALSLAVPNNTELLNARSPYITLKARLDDMTGGYSGGNIATLTNGTAAAGQKVVAVDSTTGFLAGAYVAYTLVGGAVEYNLVDTVTDPTHLLLTTNIGTGGIGDNVYIGLISTSEYQAANAIPHAGALTLPQAMQYSNGNVFNIMAYGASPGASAAVNAVAIQAAINALAIEAAGSTGTYAGTLLIPPGVFQISNTLTFQSLRGFKMIGTGGASRLVWVANDTTKSMIDILDCRNSFVGNMSIQGTAGGGALPLSLIRIANTQIADVPVAGTSRFNRFADLFLDYGINSVVVGGVGHDDVNNDFMIFENVEFNNYTGGSAINYVDTGTDLNTQAYNYMLLHCGLNGGGVGQYGVKMARAGGLMMIGGGGGGHTIADFEFQGSSQPLLIEGANFESSPKFMVVTGQSAQVVIRSCRLAADGVDTTVSGDKTLMTFQGPAASLKIENCCIGDGQPDKALMVAKVTYGNDANSAAYGSFIFNNNLIYSTLDGTTYDGWPFDNASASGTMLPTEASGNLIITDTGTSTPKRLAILHKAPTGAYLENPYPFTQRVGKARVVRTSHAAYPFTTFANVPPYHIFTVICDHTNTFVDKSTAVTGDNLWLAGHVDFVATVGSSITFYHDFDNDRFIEIGRSQY